MTLAAGTKLGHYEVISSLGAGGMGEVYRAKDTKLGREVAIKLLLDEVSTDPERLARFEREAKVLASLNHPNIASLHAFEQDGDTGFLVMELVEGETLADRIKRGAIPVDEALPLFLQIAEGLEAAHEKGVIHRDLKPANIKVTDDGHVKILDFGLAKAMAVDVGEPSDVSLSMSPTLTLAATQRGEILGTAAYMSPEQAKGKIVDKRADIWAFGVCLFEALSGQCPFSGRDVTDVMAAVLATEPLWDSLPASAPAALRRLVQRCMEKDRSRRVPDIGYVLYELKELDNHPTERDVSTVPSPGSGFRRWIPWAAVVALLVALMWQWIQPRSAPPRDTQPATLEIVLPENLHLDVGTEHPTLALSPDGSRLIFVGVQEGVRRLYRRDLGDPGYGVFEIEGTEGAASPFFSPDGEQLAFFDTSGLKTVSSSSGVPTLVDFATNPDVNRGGAWLDSRTFVYVSSANESLAMLEVAIDGAAHPVNRWSDISGIPAPSSWPFALPDGRSVLFTDESDEAGTVSVGVYSLDTGEATILQRGGTNPRYSNTGHVLYARAGSLYAIAYDVESGETGSERLLVSGIQMGDTGAAQYAVANGTLVYVPGDQESVDHELVWVDRSGKVVETIRDDNRRFHDPRLSPDGSQIALMSYRGSNLADLEVLVLNLARGDLTPWTSDPGEDFSPVWHPNGGLALATEIGEDTGGQSGPALGWLTGPNATPEQLFERPGRGVIEMPGSWSPDGKWLAFTATDGPEADIYILDFEARTAEPFIATVGFRESTPIFSPDGKWIAYVSDRSGVEDVWIARFPGGTDSKKVSTAGGIEPVWSRDGDELFYRDRNRLMSVGVKPEGTLEVPRPLFVDTFERTRLGHGQPDFDVSRDGERFLMVRLKNPVEPTRVRVVLGWPQVFGLGEG